MVDLETGRERESREAIKRDLISHIQNPAFPNWIHSPKQLRDRVRKSKHYNLSKLDDERIGIILVELTKEGSARKIRGGYVSPDSDIRAYRPRSRKVQRHWVKF